MPPRRPRLAFARWTPERRNQRQFRAADGRGAHDPGLLRAGQALVDNDLPTAEALLRPLPQAPADRRRRDPHDGRACGAHRPPRRRREPAAPRARAGARLHRRARQSGDRALPAEPRRRGARRARPDRAAKARPTSATPASRRPRSAGSAATRRRSRSTGKCSTPRPDEPKLWMSYGHVLKTVGEQDDSDRRLSPRHRARAGAGRSLVEPRQPQDRPLRRRRRRGDGGGARRARRSTDEDRFHLHFALGKALEDRGEAEAGFGHYAEGNACAARQLDYDPARDPRPCRPHRSRLFTPEFFAARAGQGCPAPDPIFILGMPRAGSTLVEQILASHPQVEGTMELPDIPAIARRLDGRRPQADASVYPECLAEPRRRRAARARRGISRARRGPAQDRPAVLHRQDAEQLGARRPDPPDPAEREDHRRAPASARLLLLQLQAAFRARPELQLRPRPTSAAITPTMCG